MIESKLMEPNIETQPCTFGQKIIADYNFAGAVANFTQGLGMRSGVDFKSLVPAQNLTLFGCNVFMRPAVQNPIRPGHNEQLERYRDQLFREHLTNKMTKDGYRGDGSWTIYDQFPGNPRLQQFKLSLSKAGSLLDIYLGTDDPLTNAVITNEQPAEAACARARTMLEALRKHIEFHFSDGHKSWTGLSIAAGSGDIEMAAIEKIAKIYPDRMLNLVLVDLDRAAIRKARSLAAKLEGEYPNIKIKSLLGMAGNPEKDQKLSEDVRLAISKLDSDGVHFGLALGLLDYLGDQAAALTLKQLYNLTNDNAVIAAAQVRPLDNEGLLSLYNMYGWPNMVHRDLEDLSILGADVGFSVGRFEVTPDPQHTLGMVFFGKNQDIFKGFENSIGYV